MKNKRISMNKSLQPLAMAVPLGSLDSYIHWANQVPMLTAEEEYVLATRFYKEGDLEAARELVMAHLRFVIKVARGYSGYGLQQGDLIQEGNIGLMKAVKRFNPNMGVRLVSFAVHWIKAEIHEFVLRNWRVVKVATTKAQRKLFFNLRKASKRLGWFTNAEVDAVAEELNVSPEEVRCMEARLNSMDVSFDEPVGDDEVNGSVPAHYLEDQGADPASLLEAKDWSGSREAKLHQVIGTLDARSQDILSQRWLSDQKATLHDLAAKHKISAERIRQLENQAMKKLKTALAE